ncbi:hypothetical protein [Streptomyces griseosporeus]|uniref:hypothetical protein n=1 Tax=Streptomyces griseosporeus TaxID=1910 RepID=UPI0036FD5445
MTPRPEKQTQLTTARPRPTLGGAERGRGTKSDGRQAVLSALPPAGCPTGHPQPGPDDPTPERPGIRISAPPVYRHHNDGARWSKRNGDTRTAGYACPCGQTRTARGQAAVAALVTDYETHKHACTGTPTQHTERRNAA